MKDVKKRMMKELKDLAFAFAMAFAGVGAVALGVGVITVAFKVFEFFK